MRVLVLFVRHGEERYPNALYELADLYHRRAPALIRSTVVIDNALPAGLQRELGSGCLLIGGDNTWWEFSGWQRAIRELGNEIKTYDVVHLVTSAFRTLYTDYLERFCPQLAKVAAERPIAVGHIDYYPHPVRVGVFVSRHWVRSSFWLINPFELLRLRTLVSLDDAADLFSVQGGWPFAETAPLSYGYQRLIYDWLTTREGTGQGTTWHSRFKLNETTHTLFQNKTTAIVNEHLLSIRLRAQGTHLLDLTYLAELIRVGRAIPTPYPHWRVQMKMSRIPAREVIEETALR
jgi:hypothetical protein